MDFEGLDIAELKQRLKLSHALFMIAKTFVSTEEHDVIIERALELLGKISDAGRVYLFLFDKDGETMDNTHEWCNEGVSPKIDNLKGLPISVFPWWIRKIRNDEIINISDVDSMPDEARAERELLQSQDIKSILVLPISIDGVPSGYVGLDNVQSTGDWDEETQEHLLVAGEMIGMSVSRHRIESKIIVQKLEIEKAADELKKTQARLIHSEKLAGIGQLAAGVAHEINNPVGFVMSNTRTIRRYVDRINEMFALFDSNADAQTITEKKRELNIQYILKDIGSIQEENWEGLKRIEQIVNNLKQFSRADLGDSFESVDLNKCVHSSLSIANNELKYCADVELNLGDVPPVPCNAGAISQVLLNILINASQAVAEENGDARGKVGIATFEEDDVVVCEISDNGPGIPKEIQSRIFEPFFTTKDVGEGTGLGLSIAYDIIVNKHKGDLSVETVEPHGTMFRIELPLMKGIQ